MDDSKTSERLVAMFKTIPLFAGLTKDDLRAVANVGREVSFRKGQNITKEGEFGIGFLLILEGRVEVVSRGKKIATLGGGEFFGEMAVIDGLPRTADVVAAEPTKCFGLTSWEFSGLVSSRPAIAIPIMKELVKRLRKAETGVLN